MSHSVYGQLKVQYMYVSLICFSLIFLINPIISISIAYLFLYKKCGNSGYQDIYRKYFITLALLSIVLVSLVNSTKVPFNDLVWYIDFYKRASNVDLLNYILGEGQLDNMAKEPGYTSLVWIINRIFNGDVHSFLFVYSFISYAFLNMSLLNLGKHFRINCGILATSILFMTFFPYIFTMSLQLLRQFLASCILLYLMTAMFFYSQPLSFIKRYGVLAVFMVLVHTTAFIFLPMLLFPFLDKQVKCNKVCYSALAFCLLTYQLIAVNLLQIMGGGIWTYGLERASHNTTFDLGEFSLLQTVVVIVFVLMSYYVGYIKIRSMNKVQSIKRFCNIVIILGVFIITNRHQSELSNRLLFYLFPMFPILYILIAVKFKFSFFANSLVTIWLVIFWSIYLYIGTWDYQVPLDNVYVSPGLFYFM